MKYIELYGISIIGANIEFIEIIEIYFNILKYLLISILFQYIEIIEIIELAISIYWNTIQ